MSFLKKITDKFNSTKNQPKHDIGTNTIIDPEFISLACHYNKSTVLNKNGELIQIIKIEDYKVHSYNNRNLRSSIRNSISNNIQSPEFSIWVYNIRRTNKFELPWQNNNYFPNQLHDSYLNNNNKVCYTNDIYIAVVINALKDKIKNFPRSLLFRYVKNLHKKFFANSFIKLENAVNAIIKDLENFQAQKLGIISKDNVIRSEIIELFNYILTFRHEEINLATHDISEIINNFQITVGFNAFEIIKNNTKKFGGILEIKEYRDTTSLNGLDKCLQLDCELISTEIIRFVKSAQALKPFKKQIELLQISNDTKLLKQSGLDITQNIKETSYTDFCEHKIIFTFISDKIRDLNNNISNFIYHLSTVGLMAIRHDIQLEDTFWAQLPANFSFVINTKYSLVKYICGFSLFHNFPSGSLTSTRWKNAITMFFSNKNKPYFFNYHYTDKGHSLIIGPPHSGRTTLINFLLSESTKLNVKILRLDYSGKSLIFTKALNGKYFRFDPRPTYKTLSFNPLAVEDTENNRNMIHELITRMIGNTKVENISDAINKILDYVFTLPMESRSFSNISQLLIPLGGDIHKWVNKGEFSHMFNQNTPENFNWNEKMLSINIGLLSTKSECIPILMYYILNRFEEHLDGSPTILVLDEAWKINSVFIDENQFKQWIERMTSLNVVVLFSTNNITIPAASKFTQYISPYIETQIFMPHAALNRLYMKIFSLSKDEFNTMLQIPNKRCFFIKQGSEYEILSLDLKNIPEINALTANKDTIQYMYEAIEEKGEVPEEWLPLFYEKCNNK